MSSIEGILETLLSTTLYYKGLRVDLLGIPKFKDKKYPSMRATVSYLEKRRLLEKCDGALRITKAGRNYLKRKQDSLQEFSNSFAKEEPKNLLIMYDIPESRKAEREWFRWHLKKFNYTMIQKSVWIGPSPLPKDFVDYLEKIKLRKTIKTFKLTRAYKTH